MAGAALSPIGLLMAATMSVTNVLTDVARKHALHERDLIPTTFWIRLTVATLFGIVLLWRVLNGAVVALRGGPALFGAWLLLDVLLITVVTLLYFRALQISPMSMCIPFLSFTPVFLIPTGYFMLGEVPSPLKAVGVMLIVIGSFVMHRKLFSQGWLAPFKAVLQEKGSRYMLLVSLIFSFTNTIDKKLVTMSDVFTQAFAYGTGLAIAFWLMAKFRGGDFKAASRANWKWISLAGLFDAISLLFQLGSYAYIPVVITVSIKRAGIVLSVFSGWLFFREREITDKVIAASVMFCGVLVLYLPVDAVQAAGISVATLAGMCLALFLTREKSYVAQA
jgi:drug/metabolite transporter (DMT)-like permease